MRWMLAIAVLLAARPALAAQVTIQEVTYTHDATTTRDSHYTIDNLPGTPSDWTSPVDYTQGTAVVRLEVFSKPTDARTRFQICFEGSPYSCTDQAPVYTTTGVYEWSTAFSRFYSPGTPTYTRAPTKMSLILKDDKNGKPAPENVGAETSARYMPSRVRVTVTLVSAGATYVPPDDTMPDDDEPVPPTPPTPPTPPSDPETPLPSTDAPEDPVDESALVDDGFDGGVSGGCTATTPLFAPVVAAIVAFGLRRRK